MKKFLLLLAMPCFLLPAHLFAQYSDASLNGTWIVQSNGLSFMSTNGNGTIIVVGSSDDSIQPVGTYSITASGAISATLNFVEGAQNITGQMINDSSANMYDSGAHGGPIYAYSVISPGALQGVWDGVIYDSSDQAVRNVQLTIDNMGVITAATGLTLLTGDIFAGRDTFAGYITTSDSACAFTAIELGGIYTGDSLKGIADLGPHSSNCNSGGYVLLGRSSAGIAAISPGLDFSAYPDPFTDELNLVLSNGGNKVRADISDLSGRKVYSAALGNEQKSSLDLSGLSRGMYLLTVTAADGQTATKKIIKN